MRTLTRRLAVVVMATIVAGLLGAIAIEAWVRLSWDEHRGRPGLYLTDPLLGQRLAPNYEGWFAGVPVRINNLGFRDVRDYELAKPPRTFRIIVLGDSVTFGHGTLNDTTYPFLLEQRLKQWRADVNWQVWNLGVPGYNTRQELEYLHRIGRQFAPDLVIVGFFANDYENNQPIPPVTATRRTASAVQRVMQRYLYSFDFYKRVLLTARWRLFTGKIDRQRLEHLATEEALLNTGDVSKLQQQQLTTPHYFTDEEVASFECTTVPTLPNQLVGDLRSRLRDKREELIDWVDAVRDLQALNASGQYRIMFFVNMAPQVCPDLDRFYRSGVMDDDAVLTEILGAGTPVASSTSAFLHYRPSEMPAANAHSIGNSNAVKADALFRVLRENVLPDVLNTFAPQ